MRPVSIFTLLVVFTVFLVGCQPSQEKVINTDYDKEEWNVLSATLDIPETPLSYRFGNIETGAELDHIGTFGRVLFYDKRLSADESVSCASCHQQSLAFADDRNFSAGANDNVTTRNSMALGSFRSFGSHYEQTAHDTPVPGLFWDERAESIAEQLRQTIHNPNEMGMEMEEIVSLIESTDYYRVLHKKAFDTEQVAESHILDALETFINSINSVNTKFETEVLSNLNFITGDQVSGTIDNELGFRLFDHNCSTCHGVVSNLIDQEEHPDRVTMANNGLPIEGNDLGAYGYTQDPEDMGKFKIPGLLNIELTAPYMHDGRFATLEEVIDFYSEGIEFNDNLHSSLREGNSAKQLNFTTEEKEALVDFLKLLTDQQLVVEEKWSNPFK